MKRRKSLVVKVFLFTAGLLLGISLLTWILIASFLPSTYKNELENRLAAAAGELVEELEQYDSWEKAENLLQLFAATNQAGVKLLDEEGEILFSDSWIDMKEDMVGMAVEAAEEPEPPAIHSVRDGAETGAEETECAWNGAVISELDREASPNGEDNVAVVTEENILAGDLAEKEGTSAMKFYPVKIGEEEGTLLLFGTMKSVSQAMAVLKRLLPMIFLVVLAVSLLCAAGASVYLASPIRRLSRVAGEMAALNFQEKCPVGRSDEIGFLGESLNELSGNLDQALNELKESNQKLRSFFAAASHELKTPVTVLKGHLGGMCAKLEAYRNQEEYLHRSYQVAESMEEMIREILAVSRMESGTWQVSREQVDLAELLRSLTAQLWELVEGKELHLELQAPEHLFCQADGEMMKKVFSNLLTNGIRYSPKGARIRMNLRLAGLQDILFWIENTGVHLSEEALDRMFEPFYREETSRNRESGGSGLGLYIVKMILDLHQAEFGGENSRDGVRIWFRMKQENHRETYKDDTETDSDHTEIT